MSDHAQVKKFLKDSYELAGFDVVDERPNGETILRYGLHSTVDVALKLTQEDIHEYAELVAAREDFQALPAPTSLCSRNFREQLLLPLDASIHEQDVQDVFFKRDEQQKTYVEIDRVSLVYANFFRFDPAYLKLCVDRLLAVPERYRRESQQNPLDIRHIFARPLGIRVFNIAASSIEEAQAVSDELIESSLFTLAYEYDIPLMLAQEWPRSRVERQRDLGRRAGRAQRMIVPEAGFRSDLVRLYQAGIASPIPTQQFLSFYQILEFFFQEVDHAGAYAALQDLLSSPDFSPDDEHIMRVIQTVESNTTGLTQADLLEMLLRQYVGSEAIKRFIESQNGAAEETLRTLSQRLVELRSAVVNVGVDAPPVSTDSAAFTRNVPLVRFLAEQVILSTRVN